MGYYTDYELTIHGQEPEDFETKFKEITGYHISHGELNGKWYDFKKDMIKISDFYQDVMFQLDGVGEESGDVWRMYFKNGKAQDANTKVIVTHEDFDESKLR